MELGNMGFGNSRGEYPVPRAWQDAFCARLNEMGFDCYGIANEWDENGKYSPELSKRLDKYLAEVNGKEGGRHHKWETETFVIMPYYWGDDDAICELPNFVFKPTGFGLSWYKYALRDAYMNQPVTFEELDDMLRVCVETIREGWETE